MLKLISKKLFKLFLLTSLVLTFLVLGNLYTYQRLNIEKPIAKLVFTSISEQEFNAILRIGDFCEESTYKIYGDEWRIDSQFLKWKSWANLLGLDAMYRLDRLSGRYSSINDENTKIHIAHELQTDSTLSLSKLAERYSNKFPPVDTIYGSSAYQKIKLDTQFVVFANQSGILIREQVIPSSPLTTDCIDKSKWKNAILITDQKLASLFRQFKSI